MRIRSVLSHSVQALAEGVLISLLVVGLIAGTALAARGGGNGGGSTGSFSLVLLDSTDGTAHYGQDVTFTVTSNVTYPMVNLTCYQNGDWVTNQSVGFYAGWPWSQDFPLSSWKWTGGAADCDARLYTQTRKGTQTLATMSFHVGS